MTNMTNHSSNLEETNKTPEISEFTQLFRGISAYGGDAFNCIDAKPDLTNLDCANSEKTFDLQSLLNEQQQHHNQPVLAQLNPVQMTVKDNLMLCENSVDSQTSFYSRSDAGGEKRKSSETSSVAEYKPSKRGRKPASQNPSGEQKSKFAKQIDPKTSKESVFFGNKKVEVGTPEYGDRRKKNNEAVKKCREKAEKEQKERETKMKKLEDENQRLSEQMKNMSRDMNVLKNLIISISPDHKIPDFIQKEIDGLKF